MLPQSHFLFGLTSSIVLYFGFDVGVLGCLIFLIATVGIDVDHYLYYVYRKRDWSLRNAFYWFIKKRKTFMKMNRKRRSKFCIGFYFLHGIEILVLILLLGWFIWDGFYFIVMGFLFHLTLDWTHNFFVIDRLDKYSVAWDYFKFKRLEII